MVSFCELCGKQTDDKKKVMVENSVFNVCISCSKRGKPIESNSNFRTSQGKNTRIIGKPSSHYLTSHQHQHQHQQNKVHFPLE